MLLESIEPKKNKRKKITVKKAADVGITYLALIIISFIFFFPCLWLILASLSKAGSIFNFDGFFPPSYGIDSFVTLFTDTGSYQYPTWFSNTLYISGFSCLFGTILVILTAYVMSRFHFRSRKKLMQTTLILGMFPSFMAMTAVYILMTQFNMLNNHWGLILIYSAGAPMGYMLQKGFFDSIPNSIDEAARIDGASNLRVFVKIILPLSFPMLVYTALTSFTWPWSDFILPQLLLSDKNMWTVAVGLMNLGETEFSRFAAGSVFIAVPIVALYFALSKFLVMGIGAGAVKE